ncbi:MAG: metallophosphoesterase [Planctomycetia bacterium]|nr:metallophosphoesterase [Planctomycetia bacterium]
MKIGVLSDTHDNLEGINAAVNEFRRRKVEVVLHAGDYVAPFALKAVLKVGVPVHGVFGNCDGEHAGLAQLMPDISPGPKHIQLGGAKICMIHDANKITHEDLASSDIVVCGHTHMTQIETREGCLWVNPGECGGQLTGSSTVVILDIETRRTEVIEIL